MKLTDGQKAQLSAMRDVKGALLGAKKRALKRAARAVQTWPADDPRTMTAVRRGQEVYSLVEAIVPAIDNRIEAAKAQSKRGETGVRRQTKAGGQGKDERSDPGLRPLFPSRDDGDARPMGV